MATQQEIQEQFDALVAEHGAEAISVAVNSHVQSNTDGQCPQTPCGKGYICVNNVCVLNIG